MGSADPGPTSKLREDYGQLARESVKMETALTNLQYDLACPVAQRFLNPLLMQIRSIERRIAQMTQLLALVESGWLSP